MPFLPYPPQGPLIPFSHLSVRPFPNPYGEGYPYSGRAFKNAIILTQHARPLGLSGAVGVGNYLTRKDRTAPKYLTSPQLYKADHIPSRLRKKKADSVSSTKAPKLGEFVEIPTVSQRRVKDFSKNKILRVNKAMPYRKKKSSTSAKKGRRSYRKRIPLGIPRSKVVRFRYSWTGNLNGAGGAIDTEMAKANDLNDPSSALSTALPNTLDQYAAMYQKYIVLGSKLTIRFGLTTNTGPVVCGVHLADNNTALTNLHHYKELPNTKQVVLTTQKDYAVVTMKYSGKKFWRLTNIKDDSEQEGSFSTAPGSPTDIAYYHIYAQDLYGNNNAVVDFQIEEEFIVYLCDPITVAQSSL